MNSYGTIVNLTWFSINKCLSKFDLILDEDALSEILNKDEIRDKPICIVAVAGKIYVQNQTAMIKMR